MRAAQRRASVAPLAGVKTGTADGIAHLSKSRPAHGPRQRRQLHAMLGGYAVFDSISMGKNNLR